MRCHNAQGRVFDGEAFVRTERRRGEVRELSEATKRFEVNLRRRFRLFAIIRGREHLESASQAEFFKQVLDFAAQAAARDGERVFGGRLANEFHCAWNRRQAVADELGILAGFPGN